MPEQKVKEILRKCTKEDLIWLIEYIDKNRKFSLTYALSELRLRKIDLKLKEADNWATISSDCMKKYIELLKQAKESSIDSSLQKEMHDILRDYERADKEYNKCLEEIDSYGL